MSKTNLLSKFCMALSILGKPSKNLKLCIPADFKILYILTTVLGAGGNLVSSFEILSSI